MGDGLKSEYADNAKAGDLFKSARCVSVLFLITNKKIVVEMF